MHPEFKRLLWSSLYPILFTAMLWVVHLSAWLLDENLYWLGIYPHHLSGLPGIITTPFIHGDFMHLFNNSIPLIFLGTMLFYFYKRLAWEVFLWIYLMSGFWVWIIARPSYHIGASSIIYGLAAFLFFSGTIRRSFPLMSLSLLVVALYGGMIWGLLPILEGISWEGHMMGGLAGLVCAIYYRKRLTPFDLKRELQEEDEPDDSDPYWMEGVEQPESNQTMQAPPVHQPGSIVPPIIEIRYEYKEKRRGGESA